MSQPDKDNSVRIVAHTNIPYNVFSTEVEGAVKQDFFREVAEILEYYEVYTLGADFSPEGTNSDYVASDTRYKKIRTLIDKEARFLFSIPPTFTVNKTASKTSKQEKDNNTVLNEFLNTVLDKTAFSLNLLKATKDCFIGKRVACMLNFNDSGIDVTFLNSTEFLYEMSGNTLTRLVAIYQLIPTADKASQTIKKKVYEMGDDGFCYVEETLYSGTGEEKEEGKIERTRTKFQRIPGVVIFNDGLTNDSRGESEVALLNDYESRYSGLANADVDAERKSMNPIRYAIDASTESTANLSSSPGSFWDIQSDQNGADPKNAKVGLLEAQMNYKDALKVTLDRISNAMHSQIDVPNLDNEQLQGLITSGKTLKALYWGLIVRCNEKMLTWGPALRDIADIIIEGGILYPESTKLYSNESIPSVEAKVSVENNYPLLEDEAEEKATDLTEVAAQTMSRKSYMKKWRNLTDEEVDEELAQIALERQILEDSYVGESDSTVTETIEEGEEDAGNQAQNSRED